MLPWISTFGPVQGRHVTAGKSPEDPEGKGDDYALAGGGRRRTIHAGLVHQLDSTHGPVLPWRKGSFFRPPDGWCAGYSAREIRSGPARRLGGMAVGVSPGSSFSFILTARVIIKSFFEPRLNDYIGFYKKVILFSIIKNQSQYIAITTEDRLIVNMWRLYNRRLYNLLKLRYITYIHL